MKISTVSLLPILAIAAACGGSGAGETATATDRPLALAPKVLPSDAEILRLAYDPNYHVPNDFFVDERALTTNRSYTVHHVLDDSNSYEVCSDDLVEAQALEQADNDTRAVNGRYITSYENDRYFEFVRELAYDDSVGNIGEPTSPGYARVFKCSHTNRNGVDRNLLSGYSGTLGEQQMNDDALREFTEYLWQFRFFNVSRKAVIDSYSDAPLHHTLLLALVVNQGADRCDRVDMVEWHFASGPASGEIDREFDTVHSFEAMTRNGIPEICE